MKKTLYLLILLVALGSSGKNKIINNNLIGKWKAVESYYSIGGPLIYKQISDNVVLQLNDDGAVSGNFFNPACEPNQNCISQEVYKFSIIDSIRVKFYDRKNPSWEGVFFL